MMALRKLNSKRNEAGEHDVSYENIVRQACVYAVQRWLCACANFAALFLFYLEES